MNVPGPMVRTTSLPPANVPPAMVSAPGPFRREAMESHIQGGRRGELLRISPAWVDWMYWLLVATALLGLVVATVAPLSEYAEGPAIVVSQGARDVFALAPGSVDTVDAQAGSWVKAGDPLVTLGRSSERGDLQQLEREWELQLLKVLRDPVDAPAREALATLQAQKERASTRVAERTVRAPQAGLVSEIWVKPGQQLQPGDRVASLVAEGVALTLLAALPGHAITEIRPGLALRLTLEGFGNDHQDLTVSAVSAEAVGPYEFKRYLGPERADSVSLRGSIALVRAALPVQGFQAATGQRRYAPGLQGVARVRLRTESALRQLIPMLKQMTQPGEAGAP
jgi:membrane fusion protein (multidrug efflux system)